MPKVLLVDDDAAYRYFARRQIEPEFEVVEAEGLTDALSYLSAHEVDAVLLDLTLRDSRREETVRRLKAGKPSAFVLAISGLDATPDFVRKIISDSASGYLVKGRDDQTKELFCSTIRLAINSHATCCKLDEAAERLKN